MKKNNYSCDEEIWKSDLDFSHKMHTIAIHHYKRIWGDKLKITETNGNELDRRFSIDFFGEDHHKQARYLQEKFQRNEYANFNTVTIEYMSNVEFEIPGEFFKMNIDYYIMGYSSNDESDFEHLYIFKWNQLKDWIQNHFTEEGLKELLHFNYRHSRASFLAIPVDWIPKDILRYKYHKKNTLFGFGGK